jgi:hypothetical protein
LRQDVRFQPLPAGAPELDIVVWKVNAETPQRASRLAQDIFDACARRDLHLALVELPLAWFQFPPESQPAAVDATRAETGLVTCLRSVLMKREHQEWLSRIWERLAAATAEALGE